MAKVIDKTYFLASGMKEAMHIKYKLVISSKKRGY